MLSPPSGTLQCPPKYFPDHLRRSPFAQNFVASFNRYTVLNAQPLPIAQAGFATAADDKAKAKAAKEKEKEKAQRCAVGGFLVFSADSRVI